MTGVARELARKVGARPVMLYALTIFLSAFLLFQVQFILGKHLLPWFGGTPMVWATCFVFFQVGLLAGYAYAHGVARMPRRRDQGLVHVMMLVCGLAPLVLFLFTAGTPLLPPSIFRPAGDEPPLGKLLPALALCGGLPFVVLAATSPLLQHWHSRTPAATHTYRLYALSNAGSLLGLLTYPFAFEWLFALPTQAWIWSALFLVFAVACGWIALRGADAATAVIPPADPPETPAAAAPRLRPGVVGLWILLPAASTALLVAVTNHLTQDVAPVPLLWMLPLVIYLLTFILCFDRPHWYSRRVVTTTAICTVVALGVLDMGVSAALLAQVVILTAFLFLFAFVAHGELVRLRPAAVHLTHFYLAIALGGALGGAFVGLLAPVIFPDVWELRITVLAGWVFFSWALWRDRASSVHTGDVWQCVLVVAAVLFGLFRFASAELGSAGFFMVVASPLGVTVSAAGALLAALVLALLPRCERVAQARAWPGIFLFLMLIVSGNSVYQAVTRRTPNEFLAGRNFFGVLRVSLDPLESDPPMIRLQNGTTWHGLQFLTDDRAKRDEPTSYYTRDSGVGLAARFLLRRQAGHRLGDYPGVNIGALGLGVGTVAAYAEPGDRVRFYEINPYVAVLSLADKPVFTYLQDCAGSVRVIFGDARISLENELAEGQPQLFDLLVLDVFSGDAIPLHLLTAEAFDVYRAHLRDENAVIAVHISSRYLDLEPAVMAQAKRLGLDAGRFEAFDDATGAFASTWILLTANPDFFAQPEVSAAALEPTTRTVEFTDRYSNLLRILK